MSSTSPQGEFKQKARAIIDGQHTVARSDGKGGWIKVEEHGVYLEDDGIDEVVAALSKLHQSDVARQVVATLESTLHDKDGNYYALDEVEERLNQAIIEWKGKL